MLKFYEALKEKHKISQTAVRRMPCICSHFPSLKHFKLSQIRTTRAAATTFAISYLPIFLYV